MNGASATIVGGVQLSELLHPLKEKDLPADAEPERRRRFQKVMDDLGVARIMKAHPKWLR